MTKSEHILSVSCRRRIVRCCLNIWSMVLRVLLAMLMGGIVGIEREKKGRAAGFRTYMLAALGAAVTVMLGQYLDVMLRTQWSEVSGTVGNGGKLAFLA